MKILGTVAFSVPSCLRVSYTPLSYMGTADPAQVTLRPLARLCVSLMVAEQRCLIAPCSQAGETAPDKSADDAVADQPADKQETYSPYYKGILLFGDLY